MAWYWYLLAALLIFNVGFVCGSWLSGLMGGRGLADRFITSEEDLQAKKVLPA